MRAWCHTICVCCVCLLVLCGLLACVRACVRACVICLLSCLLRSCCCCCCCALLAGADASSVLPVAATNSVDECCALFALFFLLLSLGSSYEYGPCACIVVVAVLVTLVDEVEEGAVVYHFLRRLSSLVVLGCGLHPMSVGLGSGSLNLLEVRPRLGDKPLKFQAVCPRNGTAVLKRFNA